MKKIFTAIILFALALTASAQTFSADQLEKYAKDKYGDNWTKAADNLHQEVALDNKNRLNYQEVIDCAGQTKDQIYGKAMAWFKKAFKSKDTHGVIQEENKECRRYQRDEGHRDSRRHRWYDEGIRWLDQ